MLALFDANSFYVSCERAFNPALANRPVIVLSSNDGCVVSRSNEAKALGVRMGEPWFIAKKRRGLSAVRALSSNFELYLDTSQRNMRILGRHARVQEVYSVDECFLDFGAVTPVEAHAIAAAAREQVLKWTGIPVSVGVASTKTLAKLGSAIAKTECGGVFVSERGLLPRHVLDWPVGQVWGVGPATASAFRKVGLGAVGAFQAASLALIRSQFGSSAQKTWLELNGQRCYPLCSVADKPKQLMATRTFGAVVTEQAALADAVTEFARKVARRAKREGVRARVLQVYAQERSFDGSLHGAHEAQEFVEPTDVEDTLVRAALGCLGTMYRPGARYRRAGVVLYGLVDSSVQQEDLFEHAQRRREVQHCLEAGQAEEVAPRVLEIPGVRLGSTAKTQEWRPSAANKTRAFTTRWSELPIVRA